MGVMTMAGMQAQEGNVRPQVSWLETGDTRGLYQKYCLMQSADRGDIVFRVRPRSAWSEFGLEASDSAFLKEGYSFLRVEVGRRSLLVILDNKDSFFNISPLIRKADLYFLGAYSPAIVESHSFPEPYSWQTETDLAPYRDHFRNVVDLYGDQFGKIVRSIPMPMIMHPSLRGGEGRMSSPHRFALVACALAMDRWARRWQRPLLPLLERAMYTVRYEELLALRQKQLEYDIVAADTLWAWPEHRARLYYEISLLPDQQKILTRLRAPTIGKNWAQRLSPEMHRFVMSTLDGPQESFPGGFERLLASSRLNVFACGKHWGWRQICFIALLCGTPILMDAPLFCPYFDFAAFDVWYTKDQWQDLPDRLGHVDEAVWWRIKKNNQEIFDRFLAPEAVARYMIATIHAHLLK